jgi:hyperosmotically inducible periplasmic protein
MRAFIALILGLMIGAVVVWVYLNHRASPTLQSAGDKVSNAAKSARDTVEDQLRNLKLTPEDIKADLAKGGQVVRRKAQEAGHAIADATADARITGAIKAKLLASHDLSAVDISVSTTDGVVTLSGQVSSPDDIGKAVLLAMQTDGVREVISTLQVKAKK